MTAYPIPQAKQTRLGLYLSAQEAYCKWQEAPEAVKILDVRTPEEYIFVGHPEMAVNIPLAFQSYRWNEQKKHFDVASNPDFVMQVKAWARPADTIMLMCRSGGRSAMAVNALAEAGFTQAYNIIDGMEGDLVNDPESRFHGKRMKSGWKNTGLPWTYSIDPAQMRIGEGES